MDKPFEAQVAALDTRLADAEKQARALLSRIKALRTKALLGEFAAIPALVDAVPRQMEQVATALQAAQDAFTYDSAQALSDGSYLTELQAEAQAHGLVLTERDGRVTAFPFLLKLDPRAGGVKIGKTLNRQMRPAKLVRALLKAQATTRFDAVRVLQQVWAFYVPLAIQSQPAWRPDQQGDGPVVPLNDIYELMTTLPAAASDYARDEFACDLLRLDRAPDTRTASGHRFSLPASTASKGRNRLQVYDETGAERVFAGIRFTRGGAGGDTA